MSQQQHSGNHWQKAFAESQIATDSPTCGLRELALENFIGQGFPTQREEAWRYTDLSPSNDRSLANLASNVVAENTEAGTAATLDIPNALRLLFINGRHCGDHQSFSEQAGAGITVFNKKTPIDDFIQDVVANLAARTPLTALNTAFAEDTVFIDIAPDIELSRPIYIVWENTQASVNTFPRCIVRMGTNSRATIIEHFLSNGPAFCNAATEMHCDEASQLNYIRLQDEDHSAHHISQQRALLSGNSTLNLTSLELGAAIARKDLSIELRGEGAAANTNGLLLVDGQRHADNHIYLRHLSPHTQSNSNYRGVMADEARGVFNGSIYVEKDAQKTDAQLANHNLLLSSKTEINTKPELEIYADDVKCAHGATTGRLDKSAMFYLLTRGIPEEQAEKILIAAFAEEITSSIPISAVNDRVHAAVKSRLNDNRRGLQ